MNILKIFLDILETSKKSAQLNEIQDGLLFNFSYFLSNVKHLEMTNYVYSSPQFQSILAFPYYFSDYFVVSRYVGLIKSITLRFHSFPFQIFYNKVLSNSRNVLISQFTHRSWSSTTIPTLLYALLFIKPCWICCIIVYFNQNALSNEFDLTKQLNVRSLARNVNRQQPVPSKRKSLLSQQ